MITRRLFASLLGALPFAAKVEPLPAAPILPVTRPDLLATQKVINDGHVSERWLADYCIGTDEILARVDFKQGALPIPSRVMMVLSDEQIAALKAEHVEAIAKSRQKAFDDPNGQYCVTMVVDAKKHGPWTKDQYWARM